MTSAFWCLNPRDNGWGDYGRILIPGMASHRQRIDGRAQVERVGPYIPPISLPNGRAIIVTATMRHTLESLDATLSFATADLVHAARLEWQSWDLGADVPAEYPTSGEPEDYILERSHHAETAASMSPLFEVLPQRVGQGAVRRVGPPPRTYQCFLDLQHTEPPLLFVPNGTCHLFTSQQGRNLLEATVSAACEFLPVVLGAIPEKPPRDVITIPIGAPIPEGYAAERPGRNPFTGEPLIVLRRTS